MIVLQPALLTALFIVQIVIFILCIGGTFFIYMFWDASDQYPTLGFRIFQYLLLAFPIVTIVAGILVAIKKNPYFLLLPLITIIPIVIFVVLYFGTDSKVSYIDHNRTITKMKTWYDKEFQKAQRDFVCDDGTFYSFNTTPLIVNGVTTTEIKYYPDSQIISDDEVMSFYNYPPWEIAYVIPNYVHLYSQFNRGERTDEIMRAAAKKLLTCKNKDGKLFNDIYSEEKPESQ